MKLGPLTHVWDLDKRAKQRRQQVGNRAPPSNFREASSQLIKRAIVDPLAWIDRARPRGAERLGLDNRDETPLRNLCVKTCKVYEKVVRWNLRLSDNQLASLASLASATRAGLHLIW